MPFKPTIGVSADGSKATDSPEPTTVDVGIPWEASEPIANSYLKTAKVTLPEGMGINPSSATGLVPCTDAQFPKGTNDPITVPKRRKSARSRCRRRRCRPTRSAAPSTSVHR